MVCPWPTSVPTYRSQFFDAEAVLAALGRCAIVAIGARGGGYVYNHSLIKKKKKKKYFILIKNKKKNK